MPAHFRGRAFVRVPTAPVIGTNVPLSRTEEGVAITVPAHSLVIVGGVYKDVYPAPRSEGGAEIRRDSGLVICSSQSSYLELPVVLEGNAV